MEPKTSTTPLGFQIPQGPIDKVPGRKEGIVYVLEALGYDHSHNGDVGYNHNLGSTSPPIDSLKREHTTAFAPIS